MARDIDKIIIHCSATPEGRDVKTSEIKRWHVEDNGWRDIGYHFVIELDGSIHKGRAVGVLCRRLQNTRPFILAWRHAPKAAPPHS